MEAPAAAEFIAHFSGLLLVLRHDASTCR